MFSRSIAAITIGAIFGGVIGLLLGLVLGAGNPFAYTGIGIALGGALSIPYIVMRSE